MEGDLMDHRVFLCLCVLPPEYQELMIPDYTCKIVVSSNNQLQKLNEQEVLMKCYLRVMTFYQTRGQYKYSECFDKDKKDL